ncbi:MAG: Flp pilus assembly pilin Flp [Arenicella sp.]|jgi:Flp pilus assembly pilin Flp
MNKTSHRPGLDFCGSRKLGNARKQSGATMVEYIIGFVAMVVILLVPVPTKNKNVIELLEEAIKAEHSAYIYASSLPAPKVPSRRNN